MRSPLQPVDENAPSRGLINSLAEKRGAKSQDNGLRYYPVSRAGIASATCQPQFLEKGRPSTMYGTTESTVKRHENTYIHTNEQLVRQEVENDQDVRVWRRKWRKIMSTAIVYFDDTDQTTVDMLKSHLVVLGTTVIPFFDKTVTHVISDCGQGEAVQRGRELGCKIYKVEKLIRFLTSLLDQVPQGFLDEAASAKLANMLDEETRIGSSEASRQADFHQFKGYYVLLWDPTKYNRTIIQKEWSRTEVAEEGDWPQIRYTPQGLCPFLSRADAASATKRANRAALVNLSAAAVSAPPASKRRALSEVDLLGQAAGLSNDTRNVLDGVPSVETPRAEPVMQFDNADLTDAKAEMKACQKSSASHPTRSKNDEAENTEPSPATTVEEFQVTDPPGLLQGQYQSPSHTHTHTAEQCEPVTGKNRCLAEDAATQTSVANKHPSESVNYVDNTWKEPGVDNQHIGGDECDQEKELNARQATLRRAKFGEIAASGMQRYSMNSASRSTPQSCENTGPHAPASRDIVFLQRKVFSTRNRGPSPLANFKSQAKSNDPTIPVIAEDSPNQSNIAAPSTASASVAANAAQTAPLQTHNDASTNAHRHAVRHQHQHQQIMPGSTKKSSKKKGRNDIKQSFCENCLERFDDLNEHLQSRSHRQFAANEHKFAALDAVIAMLQRKPAQASTDPQ